MTTRRFFDDSGRLIGVLMPDLNANGTFDAVWKYDYDDFGNQIMQVDPRSGQTGAAWQRACLQARKGDWFELMATYCERQRSGAPVHQWEL